MDPRRMAITCSPQHLPTHPIHAEAPLMGLQRRGVLQVQNALVVLTLVALVLHRLRLNGHVAERVDGVPGRLEVQGIAELVWSERMIIRIL